MNTTTPESVESAKSAKLADWVKLAEFDQNTDVGGYENHPIVEDRVLWLFNCIGTPTSLLYWTRLFPPLLRIFPNSRVWSALPPARPIPNTEHSIECVPSFHISLGKRKNSYQRQFDLVSPTLIRQIRRWKPKIIVNQELLLAAVYLAVFRRLLGSTRIITWIEGNPYQGTTRKPSWLVLRLRRFAARAVDLFITNNDGGRSYLRDMLHVPDEKIQVGTFLVSEIGAAEATASVPVEIPEDDGHRVKFLYVGQLIERKGVIPLIEAVAMLPADVQREIAVWLVGDGDQKGPIESLVRQSGLQNVVRVLGRQPYEALPAYYDAADVFVMPTLDDYRALVGFEALQYGLPLMHSIHDGASMEVVDEGRNGYTFDPRDTQNTSDRIRWFVENRERLPELAQSSREHSRRFTASVAVETFVTAVNRCLDNTLN